MRKKRNPHKKIIKKKEERKGKRRMRKKRNPHKKKNQSKRKKK